MADKPRPIEDRLERTMAHTPVLWLSVRDGLRAGLHEVFADDELPEGAEDVIRRHFYGDAR